MCVIGARLLPTSSPGQHGWCSRGLPVVCRQEAFKPIPRAGPSCPGKGLNLGRLCVFLGHVAAAARGGQTAQGIDSGRIPTKLLAALESQTKGPAFFSALLSFAFKVLRSVII